MERSGNFYKAIRLGYILISILIGCMAYNSLYKRRKNESRTYFLDRMQEKLNERMLRDDELDRMRR